jgi:hypothetical protein
VLFRGRNSGSGEQKFNFALGSFVFVALFLVCAPKGSAFHYATISPARGGAQHALSRYGRFWQIDRDENKGATAIQNLEICEN